MRSLFERVMSLTLLFIPVGAYAHGDWSPRFGGVMNDSGETSFELVRDSFGIVAHASDHGKPLDVTGSSPELQIVRDGRKIVFKGKPHGTAIVFSGAKLRVGDEVAMKMVSATGDIAFGRFTPSAVTKLTLQKIVK